MPIFYNTGAPTPSSKNTINSIAVSYGIRDFLLNKNLAPVYPTAFNNSPGAVKIGEPVLDTMVGTGSVTVPNGLPLETEGILRWEIATILNHFKDTSSTAGVLQEVPDYVAPTQPAWPNAVEPQGVGMYPQDMSKYGILAKMTDAGIRKKATLMNLYLDADKQVDVSSWLDVNYAPDQQIKGYLDTYGGLNLGDSAAIQASSVIGSVLNGQGLGLAKGGIVTNYDVRSSLAGRVLGAFGLINDTKLGMIGAQQLALALANNAAFNVQQAALGALNVQDNVLSLVKNGTLAGFRPNYQITVPSGTGGKVADYTAKILGFTLPKSYLEDAGSIFLSESDSPNIERANAMILNTGKGQVQALITNMFANINGTTVHDSPSVSHFRSGYAPGYTDNKGTPAINPSTYAFGDAEGKIYNFITTGLSPIPEINWNRSEMIEAYGFKGTGDEYFTSTIKTPTFTWGTTKGGNANSLPDYVPHAGEKKTLLQKTQMLFDSNGMLNLVSKKGYVKGFLPTQTQTAVVSNGISKGSAVLTSDNFTPEGYQISKSDADETIFCRSWTTLGRYDQVNKLIRHSGLKDNVPFRHHTNGSVLDDNGFPIIAPYSTPSDPKRFMFSIENLAWSDISAAELAECERGPGDLLTGKRGRIMWFPPYGINFNESSSVNWESTNFIGRGEPVYTYSNTERTGSLSFQVIVDHPTYINSFSMGANGPDDSYIASFFAGCVDVDSKFTEKMTVSEISEIVASTSVVAQEIVDTPQDPPTKGAYRIYYPNDIYTYDPTYEDGICNSTPIDYSTNPDGTGCTVGRAGQITSNTTWTDRYDYGLNAGTIKAGGLGMLFEINGVATPFSGFNDTNFLSALDTYLNEKCPNCKVIVKGLASPQGSRKYNEDLAIKRATAMIEYLKTKIHSKNKQYHDKLFPKPTSEVANTIGCPVGKNEPTDLIDCKLQRRVEIRFEYDATVIPKKENEAKPVTKTEQKKINKKITNKFYTECSFFEKLKETDNFVFDKFREKIKYFHPAFHSTTPEGLNSRLTFLHQCTRQGPTLEKQGAHNLAFGRAPVCILRIGDFYNTKIVIDNMSVDYEPLVWDLNPEGVGVQPMIANVTLSFKFLGGSSLMGPINKLQNALSFNYYANTHVYDPRADYISKEVPKNVNKDKEGKPILSPSGYYINNDFDTIYGRKMSADVQVTKEEILNGTPSESQTASNDIVNSGPAPAIEPASTATTAYTSSEIIKCLDIVSVKYTKDNELNEYEITVTLKFSPHVDVENFALKENEYVRANLYITSDSGKNQKAFGRLDMFQNGVGSTTVVVQNNDLGGGSSADDQLVSSLKDSNNSVSRDNIKLKFNIDDTETNNFINEALNKPSPCLRIDYNNGTKANCGFPYP